MSRHSRLPTAGRGALDERVREPASDAAHAACGLALGGHRDEGCGNGNGNGTGNGTGHRKGTNGVQKHRRVLSAADVSLKRLRDGQMLEKESRDDPIPELFLGEPLEAIDEAEGRTLQTQWADALKKVQSLRDSGAGSQSERWSGVATDIYKPASLTAPDPRRAFDSRTSGVPAASLDHWNYYPGPSVNRDTPQSQLDNAVRDNRNIASGAWNGSLRGGALSSRESYKLDRDRAGNLLKGRGARSVTAFENGDPSVEAAQSVVKSGDNVTAATRQERGASTDRRAANYSAQVMDESPDSGCGFTRVPSTDQFVEMPPPKSYSALVSRVQRTQSHRYGRVWGQKPGPNNVRDLGDSNSGANENAATPSPFLKKAISMREGGAHADSVTDMARAYANTACGVPKTLECASCGRSLGIIVQGNPGVDIAFCQACRPSPLQWTKPDDATGSKTMKRGIMRFCRKILRLDKKLS